ncbi:putative holin-like toxin [Virgibacillus kimchii]
MTVFQTLILMIAFSSLIVTVRSFHQKNNPPLS